MYDISLEALALIKDKIPLEQVQNLWERFLRNTWDEHGNLLDVCDCIKNIGNRQMQKPDCFPTANICTILESMGLGIWPENHGVRRPSQEEKQAIQETVHAVFGSWPCVLDAYLTCMEEHISMRRSSQQPRQLVVEILKSLLVTFQHLCCETFAPPADTEIITSRRLIRHLDSCLRTAESVNIPSLETEITALITEFENIQRLVGARTQLIR